MVLQIKVLFSLWFVTLSFLGNAQFNKDSLLNIVATNDTPATRISALRKLANNTFNKNVTEAESYLNKGLFIAEETRDVELMIKARANSANVYMENGFLKGNYEKAKVLIVEALAICKDLSKYEKYKILCLNGLGRINTKLGLFADATKELEESLKQCQQYNDDSFTIATHHIYAETLLAKGEKLNALKQLLAAQNIAEFSKHKNNDWLVSKCESALANYYNTIESYDRALDYYYKGITYAKLKGNKVDELQLLTQIGDIYISKKSVTNAVNTYEKMIELCKKYEKPNYIVYGKAGIINAYATIDGSKEKALPYLRDNPDVMVDLQNIGRLPSIYYGLGEIFSNLGNNDSALYYYGLAKNAFETKGSVENKAGFYFSYAGHFYRNKNFKEAILYLNKSLILSDTLGDMNAVLLTYKYLDSSYRAIGDFKNAIINNDNYNKTKLAIEKNGNEKELLSLEIDNEEKQKLKLFESEKEKTKIRHNIQYMGIMLGIIILFIALIAFGLFKINPKVVKWLGFISFILLFEFIILIADTWIHHLTHGEPLQILAIKVVLIALLLPFHHWIEHKVLDYITKRKIVIHHDLADNLKQSI